MIMSKNHIYIYNIKLGIARYKWDGLISDTAIYGWL